MKIYGIKACDTMKKARDWLAAHGLEVEFHDYKALGIEAALLGRWADQVGWDVLINRSGTTFRKLPEADRRDLTREKAVALMVAQPSMIKRPVLDTGRGLLVGFRPDAYATALTGG